MAKKLDKDISGSVPEKRGMLYLVVSYKDPITQKHKVKWVGMGVPPAPLPPARKRRSRSDRRHPHALWANGFQDFPRNPTLTQNNRK